MLLILNLRRKAIQTERMTRSRETGIMIHGETETGIIEIGKIDIETEIIGIVIEIHTVILMILK